MYRKERVGVSAIKKTSGRTLDYAAPVYDWLSPFMTFGQERRLRKIAIDLFSLKGEEKVLDLGCGTGCLAIDVARKFKEKDSSGLVVGLDAAPRMIAIARKKGLSFKNVRFDTGIAEEMPYGDEFFNCVVSSFFFHHVDFGLKQKTLAEIYRVLKWGGQVVIIDVDAPVNLWGRICAYLGYWIFCQPEIKENIQGRLREAIRLSRFRSWYRVSSHLGYISIFKLLK